MNYRELFIIIGIFFRLCFFNKAAFGAEDLCIIRGLPVRRLILWRCKQIKKSGRHIMREKLTIDKDFSIAQYFAGYKF